MSSLPVLQSQLILSAAVFRISSLKAEFAEQKGQETAIKQRRILHSRYIHWPVRLLPMGKSRPTAAGKRQDIPTSIKGSRQRDEKEIGGARNKFDPGDTDSGLFPRYLVRAVFPGPGTNGGKQE